MKNNTHKTRARSMNGFTIGFVVATLLIFGLIAGRRGVVRNSPMPSSLGVLNGRLADCPDSPNCVSTQADPSDSDHYVTAITYDQADMGDAHERLLAVMTGMPRVTIVASESNYIHAEFRSFLWGFVDDMEFYLDRENGMIHGRSSARMGHSDWGVNRQRYEAIKATFLEKG